MEDQTKYKSIRRKPKMLTDKHFRTRQILNITFIVLVLVTIAIYFIKPLPAGLPYFFGCATIAIIVKIAEAIIRWSSNKKAAEQK